MDNREISKYISLILRHKPEVAGIGLDSHGWAEVDALIKGIKLQYPGFNRDILNTLVEADEKQRYSFNTEKTKIRANQGHSINIDLELKPVQPPNVLYHGTGAKYVELIDVEGLISKSRQYVHLSSEIETAVKVGMRHGKPVVYEVDSCRMYKDGYEFYISENAVWLTLTVPAIYLRKIET